MFQMKDRESLQKVEDSSNSDSSRSTDNSLPSQWRLERQADAEEQWFNDDDSEVHFCRSYADFKISFALIRMRTRLGAISASIWNYHISYFDQVNAKSIIAFCLKSCYVSVSKRVKSFSSSPAGFRHFLWFQNIVPRLSDWETVKTIKDSVAGTSAHSPSVLLDVSPSSSSGKQDERDAKHISSMRKTSVEPILPSLLRRRG